MGNSFSRKEKKKEYMNNYVPPKNLKNSSVTQKHPKVSSTSILKIDIPKTPQGGYNPNTPKDTLSAIRRKRNKGEKERMFPKNVNNKIQSPKHNNNKNYNSFSYDPPSYDEAVNPPPYNPDYRDAYNNYAIPIDKEFIEYMSH